MNLVVKLGPWNKSQHIAVEVSSADILIAELLEITIGQLPITLTKMIRFSRAQGADVFFSTTPKGPERLVESYKLRDYEIKDGSTLWLMWSYAAAAK
jgi:hypothetical protein